MRTYDSIWWRNLQITLSTIRHLYKDKLAVIGNGVVVDPVALLKELDGLNERGISTDNLRISNRAQVILPITQLKTNMKNVVVAIIKLVQRKKVSAQHT